MKKEEMKSIVDTYVNAYNSFDIETMSSKLDENITFKNTENGIITLQTSGLEEFKQVANSSKDFFESREQKILEYDFGETFVIIYINFKARFAVDLNEKFKAGDEISVGGKSIFTFENGKIISLEDYS